MDHIDLGKDPEFMNKLQRMAEASGLISVAVQHSAKDGPEFVVLSVAALIGPLTSLAFYLRPDNKNENPSPDQVLLAALIVTRSITLTNKVGFGGVDFSPNAVLEAMEDFEKLTGRKPDDIMIAGMAKGARNMEHDSMTPFASFLNKRKEGKPN